MNTETLIFIIVLIGFYLMFRYILKKVSNLLNQLGDISILTEQNDEILNELKEIKQRLTAIENASDNHNQH
ncbi:MAG: hypothetical protein WBA59_05655 [Moheibacter sp.]